MLRTSVRRTNRRMLAIAVAGAVMFPLIRVGASRGDEPPKEPIPPLSDTQIKEDQIDAATQLGQNELDAAAESVTSIANTDTEHYLTVGIDLAKKSVVVWRKGGGSGLDDQAKQLYENESDGFPVEFRDAPLSKAETEIVQNSLLEQYSDLQSAGIIITLIGAIQTGEPLVIQYSAKGTLPNLAILESLGITKEWPQAALNGGVEFAAGEVAPFDRISDNSPLYGATRIHGPSIEIDGDTVWTDCTTGFAARSTTPGNTAAFITTAWHCYKPSNPVMYNQWTSPGNYAIGNVSSTDTARDTAFVKIGPSRTSTPRIYTGGPGNNTSSKPVVGMGPIASGDNYCASGANSYNICNGGITATGLIKPIYNAYTGQAVGVPLARMAQLVNAGVGLMGAEGDSGGPVYSFSDSSGQSVVARGMISAGDTSLGGLVPCPSYITDVEPQEGHPTKCSTVLFIVSASDLAAAHHVTFVF